MYSPNNLLWKLDPTSGTLVQTLTSGATLPVGALAYANGYLWAHSSSKQNFNYLLWKLNPANGTAVQTLTSGVPADIGGLASADGYLWAHSANPYNSYLRVVEDKPDQRQCYSDPHFGSFPARGCASLCGGDSPHRLHFN